ncbi:MAG: HipA protein [Legionellales bacterium]|nr:HipA protein [Legionellales bacterium]|tara:strand:- start:48833 stop:50131 length:1299 start_codon:yes stop_codon:yes gene_type:complete
MAGTEHALDVYLGKTLIAQIALQDDDITWQYQSGWLHEGYSLSPHLPLQEDIPTVNAQRFLRNLLPEGDGLEELLRSFHLSKQNTFGLVKALGLDVPGALVIVPAGESLPESAAFRELTTEELTSRLNSRDEFGLIIWDDKPRLSVAGIQDKINLIVTEDGLLGFGEGRLCSTHILKFEKQRLSHLVLNEYLTMQLAKRCGLPVAETQLMRFGSHPALLVKRFDRKLIAAKEIERHHIIDGCQALNLPPEYKYERNFGSSRDVAHIREGASLPKLFEFANQCNSPIQTRQVLLDWVLFNSLVFNYDAHGKNISFYVSAQGLSLTPFYDLVNIRMYPDFEQDMAMALGDEFDGNSVNAYQLADFADTCQLPRSLVANRLNDLSLKLLVALDAIPKALSVNQGENNTIERYSQCIKERATHLLEQSQQIEGMAL